MKRLDWKSAYEPIPAALESRVRVTLAGLEESKARGARLPLRTVVAAVVLVLTLGGVSYAVLGHRTADLFGWFYGGNWQKELENGAYAPAGQRFELGDVAYTIEEMVYKTEGKYQGLYGVVRITPVEGSNIVLLPEDLSEDDPAGYLLHYGDVGDTIPDDAPSYAELARERGASLLRVRAAVDSLAWNGQTYKGSVGENWLPQKDGSILGTLEIADDLPYADSYELELHIAIREASQDEWQSETWHVTLTPEKED